METNYSFDYSKILCILFTDCNIDDNTNKYVKVVRTNHRMAVDLKIIAITDYCEIGSVPIVVGISLDGTDTRIRRIRKYINIVDIVCATYSTYTISRTTV